MSDQDSIKRRYTFIVEKELPKWKAMKERYSNDEKYIKNIESTIKQLEGSAHDLNKRIENMKNTE